MRAVNPEGIESKVLTGEVNKENSKYPIANNDTITITLLNLEDVTIL